MDDPEAFDSLFSTAVSYLDGGQLKKLKQLLISNPGLAGKRLEHPGPWLRESVGEAVDGYFKQPYLLWFVAGNPVRMDKLPANIVAMTRVIIEAVKREAADNFQQQLDYTLELVATGRIARECGMQIRLMDLLIDAGAKPGGGVGALAHGNIAAARHLIERGAKLTLPVAVCLDQLDDAVHLAKKATPSELQVAFVAAAFYGNVAMLNLLLGMDIDINAFPQNNSGFHSHATALHQAVASGSLDAVKMLIKAGGDPGIRDQIYNGTPLDWAEHMQKEGEVEMREKFAAIASWLRDNS